MSLNFTCPLTKVQPENTIHQAFSAVTTSDLVWRSAAEQAKQTARDGTANLAETTRSWVPSGFIRLKQLNFGDGTIVAVQGGNRAWQDWQHLGRIKQIGCRQRVTGPKCDDDAASCIIGAGLVT